MGQALLSAVLTLSLTACSDPDTSPHDEARPLRTSEAPDGAEHETRGDLPKDCESLTESAAGRTDDAAILPWLCTELVLPPSRQRQALLQAPDRAWVYELRPRLSGEWAALADLILGRRPSPPPHRHLPDPSSVPPFPLSQASLASLEAAEFLGREAGLPPPDRIRAHFYSARVWTGQLRAMGTPLPPLARIALVSTLSQTLTALRAYWRYPQRGLHTQALGLETELADFVRQAQPLAEGRHDPALNYWLGRSRAYLTQPATAARLDTSRKSSPALSTAATARLGAPSDPANAAGSADISSFQARVLEARRYWHERSQSPLSPSTHTP